MEWNRRQLSLVAAYRMSWKEPAFKEALTVSERGWRRTIVK
jgi:hypothetical protein